MTGADQAETEAGAAAGFFLPYAEIFAIPRAWRFFAAGIIGRMPIAMTGLGIVLLISSLTGRYGVAGSVAAAAALGTSVAGPRIARWADRYGQRAVIVPVAVAFALSVLGLIIAAQLRAPSWAFFPPGIAVGATMTSLGPLTRARWSMLLAGSPRLHTAFSVESVADEVCFVVGPALVTVLSTQVHAAAGITAAVVFGMAGSLWFAAQRSTEPPASRPARPAQPSPERACAPSPPRHLMRRPGTRESRLAAPALTVIVPVYLFLGAMFVTIDLSTVAFATSLGHKALSGLLLGIYALGSGCGGLWYGSRTWRAPAARRLAVTLCLTVAGVCTFGVMPDLVVLAGVLYLCGMTIAPTLVAGVSVVEATALPGRLTEAMTWMTTGLTVGVAGGSTAAGFILDGLGARWGYAFAAACGCAAAAVYLAGLSSSRALRHP
jgi:predicted MFS family arabinose efflux permease